MSNDRHEESRPVPPSAASPAPCPTLDVDALFREHHDHVFRAAYRVTGNATDAEDVVQTVFLRLVRREDPPDLSATPAGYLYRAAVNAALDVVRARGGKERASDGVERSADGPGADPEQRLRERELAHWLRAAVARLPPRTAEIFALRYFEGYANARIAELVGSTRGAVAVTLHRARQQLKSELGGILGDAAS